MDHGGFFDIDEARRHVRSRRAFIESEEADRRRDKRLLELEASVRALRDQEPAGAFPEGVKLEFLPLAERVSWRDVPRVCIPGFLIGRVIARITDPLYQAGPEICRRLERHTELPDDIPGRAHPAALLRSVAIWLTESPNVARRAIPEQTSGEASSRPRHDPSQVSAPESSRSEGKE